MVLLGVAVLLGSGATAGVLFAVALSVVPALAAMSPERYVDTHVLLGRRWDPTMPLIVLTTVALDVVLAFVASDGRAGTLFATAAVLLFGVSVVSHLCNVPINRRVKTIDPRAIPPDWVDPRPVWRSWHLLRTVLAALGLVANSLAITLT